MGSQTSNRMFESVEGLMTPVTRHEAGRFVSCCPLGRVKAPAGTGCAAVIAVSGSTSEDRLSQLAAIAVAGTPQAISAATPSAPDTTPRDAVPRLTQCDARLIRIFIPLLQIDFGYLPLSRSSRRD